MKDEQLVMGSEIMQEVYKESDRQIKKCGIQDRTPEEWLMYLTEEVGELAQAIADHKYGRGQLENVLIEGIQVTTLSMKIIEMYVILDEKEWGGFLLHGNKEERDFNAD